MEEKWQGKATAELKGLKSDQIWPLLSDFFVVDKWLPHLDTCHQVDVDGEPRLVRYVASSTFATSDEGEKGEETIKFAKERLLSIDHQQKCFSYDIVENNAGFGSYVATIRLIDGGDEGCVIEWSYVADPVVGWKPEDLLSFVEFAVHAMAARMGEFLAQPQP